MKKVTIVALALTTCMFGCNQTSDKEVKEARENLKEAKTELKDAQANENEAERAKEMAEWNNFKNEADSSIAKMENDLKKNGNEY